MKYDRRALKVTGISNFLLCKPLIYNPPATREVTNNPNFIPLEKA